MGKKGQCSADFACTGGAKWDKTVIKWELVGNQIEFELISNFPNEFQVFVVFMVKVWPPI
jgi:hypothetical protein